MNADPNPAKAIFLEAVERHASDQWPAFLDRACAGRPELRNQVEALLNAHREVGTVQHRDDAGGADLGPVATVDLPPAAEASGTVIGPYKLIEQIGEGGMGSVWMAQQTEPVKRLVAVKLIKAGMDSRQVVARFEAERQALALMDHPNIARVLDAGTTKAGRPYFVMDLVKGVPIAKYCDEHRLTPRQRLELFVPVCQAIQHAHQKGVIHRDIKPSNVLVALYDGRPVPKVIDFGVAKAAGQSLTEHTLVTGFGAIVGTLEYMSPEQAEVNQLDIDTRSDIYSLGVLLYELLAGSPPFSRTELEKAGMLEMLRVIREQEPSKPSTKLSTAEGLPTLAANRGTEPAKLTRLVRGELDWIVMKALEKDRNRRYETANGFALDVQRYLADEAVVACPPSAGYRLRKFVRRNRIALGTGVVVSAALVVAVVALAVTNLWVARERDEKAEALGDREAALREKDGALTTARESETRAVRSATKADQERKRAESYFLKARVAIRDMLTQAAMGMGQWKDLPPAFRKNLSDEVLKFYQGFVSESATDPALRYETGWAYQGIGLMHLYAGEYEQAEALYRRSVEVLEPLAAEFPDVAEYSQQLAWSHVMLGRRLMGARRLEQAEKSFRRATELYDALQLKADRTLAFEDEATQARQGLVQALRAAGRENEVGKTHEQQVRRLEKLAAAAPQDRDVQGSLARAYFNLAQVRAAAGQANEAEKLFESALQIFKRLVAERPGAANDQALLASTYRNLWRYPDALAAYDRAIELDSRNASLWNERGVVRFGLRQFSAAVADYDKAIELLPRDPTLWANRAHAYQRLRQFDRTVGDATKALELRPDHTGALNVLRETYLEQGDWDNAVGVLTRFVDRDPKQAWVFWERGGAFLKQAQRDRATADAARAAGVVCRTPHLPAVGVVLEREARARRDRAAADFARAAELSSPEPHQRANLIGATYGRADELEESVRHYTTAVELKPDFAVAWYNRGVAHARLGRTERAEADLSRAVTLEPDNASFRWIRVHVLAARGKWPQAAADMRAASERDPRGKSDVGNVYVSGLIHLKLGDRAEYRKACTALLGRSDEEFRTNPVAAFLAAQAAVLLPDAVGDHDRPLRLARDLATGDPKHYRYARGYGAALLRAGRAKEAVTELTRATTLQDPASATWLLLALAHHRLGHADEARHWHDRAAEYIDRRSAAERAKLDWHEELVLSLFRAEAAEVLGIEKQKPEDRKPESEKDPS